MQLRNRQLRYSTLAVFGVAAALAGAATAATGTTERVSVSSSGVQADAGAVGRPAISDDGNLVAFASAATNLVPGVAGGHDNVYLHSRSSGGIELVSVTPSGGEPNGPSSHPDLSADGRYVAFQTAATNLVPGGPAAEVVVYDRFTRTTTPVSVDGKTGAEGENPSISDDGRYVAFQSTDPGLAAGPKPAGNSPYIYVRDLVKQKTVLASVSSAGKPEGDFSENPVISGDGRYVAFQSSFISPTANGSAVFVHDLQTGSTVEASVNSAGDSATRGAAYDPSISSDGRYIAFDASAQNLVPGDTNFKQDVFVHDMLTGRTTRASVDSAGNQADGHSDVLSLGPQISADGRYVAFDSQATNLVPGDTNTCSDPFQRTGVDFSAVGGCPDVFVHDLQAGTTSRVSIDGNGSQADDWSTDPALDGDGSVVAFLSAATNLVPGDTNGASDIFVHAG